MQSSFVVSWPWIALALTPACGGSQSQGLPGAGGAGIGGIADTVGTDGSGGDSSSGGSVGAAGEVSTGTGASSAGVGGESGAPEPVNPPGNLLDGYSFEDGWEGFGGLWTRDSGAGEAQSSTAVAHSGIRAVCVEHTGSRDWAVNYEGTIPVLPGDEYEFSVWVSVEDVTQNVELSVTTEGPSGVVDWLFGRVVTSGTHGFQQLTTRFRVPQGVSRIRPRFTGNGPGVSCWDDVSLLRLREAPDFTLGSELTWEGGDTTVVLGDGLDGLTVTGADGHAWTLPSLGGGVFGVSHSERSDGVDLELLPPGDATSLKLAVTVSNEGEVVLELEGSGSQAEDFELPGEIVAAPEQEWILPINEGIRLPASAEDFLWYWHLPFYQGHGGFAMPFFALSDGEHSLMIVVDTPDDAYAHPRPLEDTPRSSAFSLRFEPSLGTFGAPRRVRLIPVQGGYVAVAKRYREMARDKGLIVTLEEKAATNPAVDTLVGAVNVWWWADGPLWSADAHPEEQAQALVDRGITRVLWSQEASSESVSAIAELGFLPGRYEIVQDVWPPEAPFSWGNREGWPDELILDAAGQSLRGWVAHEDGVDYPGGILDPRFGLELLQTRVPNELATHAYGAHFLDTTTAAPLYENYRPGREMTRTDDRLAKTALLSYLSTDLGLVTGSETGIDWALPHVHYFEGMTSLAPWRLPDSGYDLFTVLTPSEEYLEFQFGANLRIPLWELVYHDCVVSYGYWGDAANRLPDYWSTRDLFSILYGVPELWIMDPSLWETHAETFALSYERVAPVARRVGYAEMLTHETLSLEPSVQRTTFSDGTSVSVNFGNTEFVASDGTIIAPTDFVVQSGGAER